VLRGYSAIGQYKLEGLYSLMALWRKLIDLSGSDQLEVDTYRSNLRGLDDDESTGTADIYSAVGTLFALQV